MYYKCISLSLQIYKKIYFLKFYRSRLFYRKKVRFCFIFIYIIWSSWNMTHSLRLKGILKHKGVKKTSLTFPSAFKILMSIYTRPFFSSSICRSFFEPTFFHNLYWKVVTSHNIPPMKKMVNSQSERFWRGKKYHQKKYSYFFRMLLFLDILLKKTLQHIAFFSPERHLTLFICIF